MSATRDRLVDDYLARLDAALVGLPAERRREIVADVAEHIEAARAELTPGDEAGLRTLLDRVGDPEQIAADARGDQVPEPALGREGHETWAIVLLLAGGFLLVAGWLVGVVLLWSSNRWRTRDKVIGTLFVPGGLALPAFLLGLFLVTSTSVCTSAGISGSTPTRHCTSSGVPQWEHIGLLALVVGLTAAAIAAAVHLARRSR